MSDRTPAVLVFVVLRPPFPLAPCPCRYSLSPLLPLSCLSLPAVPCCSAPAPMATRRLFPQGDCLAARRNPEDDCRTAATCHRQLLLALDCQLPSSGAVIGNWQPATIKGRATDGRVGEAYPIRCRRRLFLDALLSPVLPSPVLAAHCRRAPARALLRGKNPRPASLSPILSAVPRGVFFRATSGAPRLTPPALGRLRLACEQWNWRPLRVPASPASPRQSLPFPAPWSLAPRPCRCIPSPVSSRPHCDHPRPIHRWGRRCRPAADQLAAQLPGTGSEHGKQSWQEGGNRSRGRCYEPFTIDDCPPCRSLLLGPRPPAAPLAALAAAQGACTGNDLPDRVIRIVPETSTPRDTDSSARSGRSRDAGSGTLAGRA